MSDWQSHKKPYRTLRNGRLATLATVNSSQEALLYRYGRSRKILDASFVNLHMLTKLSPQSVIVHSIIRSLINETEIACCEQSEFRQHV